MVRVLSSIAAAFAFIVAASGALAQEAYPSKPIRTIIPITPGTGIDIAMRKASEELRPRLGQPLVIDNQPGANFIIGTNNCAKAAGDGYTMCVLSPDSVTNNPFIFAKLPYDPQRELKPVVNLFFLTEGLFAKTSLNVKSVKELRELAASRKNGLDFGTLGPRTTPDIVRMWLADLWNANFVGIPYKGGNLVITALVAGEVDTGVIGAYNALSQIQAGKVTLLALGGHKRFAPLPNTPVISEVGLGDMPGHVWWGIFMPATTPDSMVRRINAEFVRLYREPKFAEFIEGQLSEIAVSSPEDFAAYLRAEREKSAALFKKYSIKPE